MKKVSKGSTITTTTYVRDASGNVMAIYKNEEIQETIIYGSSRLGQYRRNEDRKETALGQRTPLPVVFHQQENKNIKKGCWALSLA